MQKRSRILPGLLTFFLFVILATSVSAGTSGFGKVDVISNCPNNQCPLFNNPDGVWVFSWVDNGFTTEKINAFFDKEEDLTVDDKVSEQDFSIEIGSSNQFCIYDINTEPDRADVNLFELKYIKEGFWYWEVDTYDEYIAEVARLTEEAGCDEITVGGVRSVRGAFEWDMLVTPINGDIKGYCWAVRDTIGQAGSLQNLRYDFETEFVLSAEGKQDIRKTLSYSTEETVAGQSELLSSDAYIIWEGNLNSGETCPTGADEYMTFNPNTYSWQLTDRMNYILYEGQLSQLSQDAKNVLNGYTTQYNAENTINSLASNAIAPRSLSYNPIIQSYSSSSGDLRVELGKRIVFPQFRLFVDSDYLELEISTGVPRLSKNFLGVCLPDNSVEFNMGDLFGGQFDVGLTNDGTERSSFSVGVKSCTNSLLSSGATDILQLDGGAMDNAKLSILGQLENVNNVKGTCVVEAEDIVSGAKDTCTISVDVSKPATCVIGRQTCSIVGNHHVIKECIDGEMEVKETCDLTEICDYNDEGLPVCVAGGQNNTSGFCSDCDAFAKDLFFGWMGDSQDCKSKTFQNMFFCIFAVLRLVAVPIFFIISLLFGFNAVNKIMKGQYKALSWTLAVLLGGIVGVVTYFAFYVGLAIFVVVAIFKFAVGFIPRIGTIRRMKR